MLLDAGTPEEWLRHARSDPALSLRKMGIKIPLTDLLPAQLAIENDCQLFSLDSHFDKVPNLQRYSTSISE